MFYRLPPASLNNKIIGVKKHVAVCWSIYAVETGAFIDPNLVFSSHKTSVDLYLDSHMQVRSAVVWSIERPPSQSSFEESDNIYCHESCTYLFVPYFLPNDVNVNGRRYRELVLQLIS